MEHVQSRMSTVTIRCTFLLVNQFVAKRRALEIGKTSGWPFEETGLSTVLHLDFLHSLSLKRAHTQISKNSACLPSESSLEEDLPSFRPLAREMVALLTEIQGCCK